MNRFYNPIPDDCNVSKGDVQCSVIEFDKGDGGLCCARKQGHAGAHINAYGYEMDPRQCGLREESLSEARAAGFKRAIALATRQASYFSMREDRSLHPDIPWEQMNETTKRAAHSTAQQIAIEINDLKDDGK